MREGESLLSRNWNLDLKFDTNLITLFHGPAVTLLPDLDFVLALDPGLDDARDSSWLPQPLAGRGAPASQGPVSFRVNIKHGHGTLHLSRNMGLCLLSGCLQP